MGEFFSGFGDRQPITEALVAEGDRVIHHATWRATHVGPVLGVAATGRTVEVHHVEIWRVEDGRIVEHWGGIGEAAHLLSQITCAPGACLHRSSTSEWRPLPLPRRSAAMSRVGGAPCDTTARCRSICVPPSVSLTHAVVFTVSFVSPHTSAGRWPSTPRSRLRPMRRTMVRIGDPEADVAPVAVFLASENCRCLTGNTLFVDGGGDINGAAWARPICPNRPDGPHGNAVPACRTAALTQVPATVLPAQLLLKKSLAIS